MGMTRSPHRANLLTDQGAIAELLNIFDADTVEAALRRNQPDVVIALLTALSKQLTLNQWQRIFDLKFIHCSA